MKDEFIYLFVVDLVTLGQPNGDLVAYQGREPGYAEAWLKAYTKAFKNFQANQVLTIELLKNIHKVVGELRPYFNKPFPPRNLVSFWQVRGNFKNGGNEYPVYLENNSWTQGKPIERQYTCTSKGFEEFLRFWFMGDTNFHDIVISGIGENKKKLIIYSYDKEKGRFLCEEVSENNEKNKIYFNLEELLDQFEEAKEAGLEEISVGSMLRQTGNIEEIVSSTLDKIINSFNEEIKEASTDDEKIRAILKHVQHIEQLHPFYDGNCRTSYILMNTLFNKYGLGLSLLLNPNRFDMCSLDELYTMAKDGMRHFETVMAHVGNDPLILDTSESLDCLKKIICTPQPFSSLHEDETDGVSLNTLNDFKLLVLKQTLENANKLSP